VLRPLGAASSVVQLRVRHFHRLRCHNPAFADIARWVEDCRVARRPIVAAPRERPRRVAFPAHLEPIAVVLDLVDPVGPDGGFGARVGIQGGMCPSERGGIDENWPLAQSGARPAVTWCPASAPMSKLLGESLPQEWGLKMGSRSTVV
jgi:hypothetical protein